MLPFHHGRFPFFLTLGLALSTIALPGSAQTPVVRERLDKSDPAQAPAGVSAAWSDQVAAQLRQSEYHFSALEAGNFGAPNRAQDMRISLGSGGLEVVQRNPSSGAGDAPWHLHLRTKAFGRVDGPVELALARVSANENRAELDHGQLREWFVNREDGIEQGWTIATRPSGVEPLWIGLEVEGLGLCLDEGGRSGRFVEAAGELRLRYTDLMAFDATGRELEAHLAPSPDGVGITIDDASAVYPLTVDPVLTGPAWTAESNQDFAFFGYSVATAGDVNGDGYSDVLVGAYPYDNGQTDEGRAYLYLGSASGLSASAVWTAEGNQDNAYFGISVASAGDVNGDGYSDVIIGSSGYDNGESDEGRAYLYLGSASGLSASAAWTAEGDSVNANLGVSVASAGDVNGDGYSDVIVGARGYSNGQAVEGRALVYLGSGTGLSTSPSWTTESDQIGAQFGFAVATAGDVNGDGYSDVIVGAPNFDNGETDEGRAFVYLGSGTGLSTSPTWTAESNQATTYFGFTVSAGDVNGDGYSDVIVGASYYDNGQTDEGRAYVYLGSGAGLSTSPAWTAEGDQTGAYFGLSVATSDVNGDGYSDVIVGAYVYDNGQADEGRAFVYLGSSSGLSSNAAWTAESNQADAWFGWSVATAGDVNGDGYGDVIVGARNYSNGQTREGRAFVYLGHGAGLSTSAAWTVEGDQAGAQLGASVADGGDVNGDGFSDVLVSRGGQVLLFLGSATGAASSPSWTAQSDQPSSDFSYSASAGDVNGDGYGDVIVGAWLYDNGETDEGRAFVYLGSDTGLSATFAWSAESNRANSGFGSSVASAGDVNGDGYGDVIIGAFGFDFSGAGGRAYVYMGSPTGLAASPAWTADGGQASAHFGYSVSSAGDVNGDGYGDVLVGAQFFDNGQADEGSVFLYLGSAHGLSASASWSYESDQASSQLGLSVSSAGDVNGDGYSDVIVGAPLFDNGLTDEGRALVFLGSPTGLAPGPAWTTDGNQTGARLGIHVSKAGDANGDGYGDILVGADWFDNGQIDEGRAFLYLGSATGLATSADWTAESDQAQSGFALSLASAGDVNGDGYGDALVGARLFANGQTNEGRAFLYYGNEGRGGRVLAPQQRRLFEPQPIAALGRSDAPGFRIQVEHPALAGGGRAFLEWEVKPLGVPFNGLGHERSAIGQSVDPFSPLSFDEAAFPGHDHLLPCKWRARVMLEGNLFFPSTPWFSIPDNARTETDLRFPPKYIRRASAP